MAVPSPIDYTILLEAVVLGPLSTRYAIGEYPALVRCEQCDKHIEERHLPYLQDVRVRCFFSGCPCQRTDPHSSAVSNPLLKAYTTTSFCFFDCGIRAGVFPPTCSGHLKGLVRK